LIEWTQQLGSLELEPLPKVGAVCNEGSRKTFRSCVVRVRRVCNDLILLTRYGLRGCNCFLDFLRLRQGSHGPGNECLCPGQEHLQQEMVRCVENTVSRLQLLAPVLQTISGCGDITLRTLEPEYKATNGIA
jgi:hypothetical protein